MLSQAQAKLARDLPGAVLTYGKVLDLEPTNTRALSALRNLQAAQRRQVLDACEALVKIDAVPHALALVGILRRAMPGDPQFVVFEARAHLTAKTYDQALQVIEPLARAHPDHAALQITMGMALAGLRRSEAAIAVLRPYYGRQELSGEAINALAACLSFLGQIDESREILRASAQSGKLSASGIYGLSRHTDISGEPAVLEQLVTIFANGSAPLRDREMAAYALASAHDRQQDYDTAFQFLQAANLLKPDTDILNFMAEVRETGMRARTLCDRITVPSQPPDDGPRPVFIVGLPRSGTTLTEQILLRHSAVDSLGESPNLSKVFNGIANDPAPQIDASAIRDAYFEAIPEGMRHNRVILDKMPVNAFLAGLALKAMPEARVIHCRRHPMACGFSAFQIRFTSGNSYAHRFDTIADYYRLSEDVANHWAAMFPDRVLPVYYEALTEAPERWIETLTEFCGLDLEDGLTDYQGSTAAIHTASVAQVRQRIYRGSSEKWKNYAPHLVPLMGNLIEEIARYEVALETELSRQESSRPPTKPDRDQVA